MRVSAPLRLDLLQPWGLGALVARMPMDWPNRIPVCVAMLIMLGGSACDDAPTTGFYSYGTRDVDDRDGTLRPDAGTVPTDATGADSQGTDGDEADSQDADTTPADVCGDGFCGESESTALCPADCGPVCGDGSCDGGETPSTCAVDCDPICGDGSCDGAESRATCAADCGVCGDGFCDLPETETSCFADCGPVCGDGVCAQGESPVSCPSDCSTCGDGVCDGFENGTTCPADCVRCGDEVCDYAELYECRSDCGAYVCGDGVCWHGESLRGCVRDCDSGEPFGPDYEKPDFLIIGVSGHTPTFGPNEEYLDQQGTLDRIARVFEAAGATVDTFGYADELYNLDEFGGRYEPPRPELWAWQYGFLMLLRDLAEARDRFVIGQEQPTRIIVVAHSHGAVWAHMALFYLADVPVDVLVTLDGESLGWRSDGVAALPGDNWGSVVEGYSAARGIVWPFGLDAWWPTDVFVVPGVSARQDVEDIVPWNVQVNLETSGDYGFTVVRDGDPNHRLDGSDDGIISVQFDEGHSELDEPYSATMDWVVESLGILYDL